MNKTWVSRLISPKKEDVRANASSFSQWVFESSTGYKKTAYASSDAAREKMKLGVMDHRRIELFFRLSLPQISNPNPSDWVPIFIDEHDDGDYLTSSRLLVNNEKLRGKPDVVLKNKKDGRVIIVERKTTWRDRSSIPIDGWANIQAQLWAYSWLDDWIDAPEVLLFGQVWLREGRYNGYSLFNHHFYWKRGETEHEALCSALFEKYGGTIIY